MEDEVPEEPQAEEGIEAAVFEDVLMRQSTGARHGMLDENVPSRRPMGFKPSLDTFTAQRQEYLHRVLRLPLSMIPAAEDPLFSTGKGLLQCFIICHSHRSNLLLTLGDVPYLRRMAWTCGYHATLSGMGGSGMYGDALRWS